MKTVLVLLAATAAVSAASVQAQTPPASQSQPQATQQRPDARYPNPSGHDSAPSTTKVPPTKTAPPSSNPENAASSTKGNAAEQTYQSGKKADDSAGCSTPTDAKSAGVDTSRTQGATREGGKKTVCTTAGAGGVGAKQKEKPDNK